MSIASCFLTQHDRAQPLLVPSWCEVSRSGAIPEPTVIVRMKRERDWHHRIVSQHGRVGILPGPLTTRTLASPSIQNALFFY
jgi:hypothetical protein